MNARTKTELLYSNKAQYPNKTQPAEALEEPLSWLGQKGRKAIQKSVEESPVIRHLDNLQGQLSQQLDSLTAVVESMQRISRIMDRMAKKNCQLNSRAGLVDPVRKS